MLAYACIIQDERLAQSLADVAFLEQMGDGQRSKVGETSPRSDPTPQRPQEVEKHALNAGDLAIYSIRIHYERDWHSTQRVVVAAKVFPSRCVASLQDPHCFYWSRTGFSNRDCFTEGSQG